MEFNDRRRRRSSIIDPTATTAERYRMGLKNPDKMGQYSRATYLRLASGDRAVSAGSAVYLAAPSIQHAPVPPVVGQAMSRAAMMAHPNTVLPQRQGLLGRLRRR